MKAVTSALRAGWLATWNGPFHVGRLTPPVALGDALLKVLETIWRTVVIIVLGLAAIAGVAAGVVWVQALRIGEPKLSDLKLTIKPYDAKFCDAKYPLFIVVENKSRRTLQRTSLTVEARRPDHSTNLVSFSNGSLDDDGIIKPGEGWGNCWSLPVLTGLDPSESPKSLVWTVRVTSAEWGDK